MPRNRSALLVLAGVASLLVGCSGSSGSAAPTPIVASRPIPADSPLAKCVDPAPKRPKPLDDDLAQHFADGRVTSTISLDDGSFRAMPPTRTTAPRIGEQQAYCTLLAGATTSNAYVIDAAARHGMSFGLGEVTVADSLGGGPQFEIVGHPLGGSETPTTTVPLKPYHARLAWIAAFRPDIVASCGVEPVVDGSATAPTSAPSQPAKKLPGYQILAIDADTGADGILFSSATNAPCGGPDQRPATVSPAKAFVSVPWTLVSRGPGTKSATIAYETRPCDGRDFGIFTATGKPAVLADRDHPGLVRVQLERTLETCGPAESVPVLLRSATLATDLPQHLVHAPVGAMDTRD